MSVPPQGILNIDNHAAERALKRVAIGRKNWLFAGHDEAGAGHARLYALIASAQRHGLDPQRYLTGVLANIAATPVREVNRFLRDVRKARTKDWTTEFSARINHQGCVAAVPP